MYKVGEIEGRNVWRGGFLGNAFPALGLRPAPAACGLQATHSFHAQASAHLHPVRVRQGVRVQVALLCFRCQRMQDQDSPHEAYCGDCSHEWSAVCHRRCPTFDAPEVSLFVLWHIQLHRGWLRGSELLVLVIMMRFVSWGELKERDEWGARRRLSFTSRSERG